MGILNVISFKILIYLTWVKLSIFSCLRAFLFPSSVCNSSPIFLLGLFDFLFFFFLEAL